MSTAPFDPSVEQLITQPHEQGIRAVAVLSGGVELPLDVVDYELSFDERRTPYVQGSIDVPVPTDQATLDQLDPRLLIRVRLFVYYRLASGVVDEHQIAYLQARRRRLVRSDDNRAILTLDLVSSEAAFIDALTPNYSNPEATWTSTSLKNAVGTLVTDAFAGTPMAGVVVNGPTIAEAITLPIAPHPWDAISDAADALDFDIYDPGMFAEWIVEPRVTAVGVPSLTLDVGANGTIVSSETGVTRDDWANWVVISYDWTDNAGVRQFEGGSAHVTGGPYTTALVGYKFLQENRMMPGSASQGTRAAKAILARMLSRSRSYTLTAVPAWWVRPRQTTALTLPLGSQERHIISSVSFGPGTMRLTTRLPDTASVIGE